jgi:hypothetical protein
LTSNAARVVLRVMRRTQQVWFALAAPVAFTAACATPARPAVASNVAAAPIASCGSSPPTAAAWPAGDKLFRSAGAWLGADSAYSIDLDARHVLWLFADTFIDPAADGSRENGPNQFIRNSVGIQSGDDAASAHDLAASRMRFYWRHAGGGAAASFFADLDGGARWQWPLHGVRLPSGELLLFRMQVKKTSDAFGFALDSWDAVAIDDPSQPPDRWQPRSVASDTRSFGKLVGSSVLVHDGHLYAYAVDAQGAHPVYLARWGLSALAGLHAGALDDPEWYTGGAFVRQSALDDARPVALWKDGQVELSVHFDPARAAFVEVQMQGLFVAEAATQLVLRTAPRPEGPWSAPTAFFRPPESQLPNAGDLAAYAGKAHPEQRGDGLVLSYVVNDLKRFPPGDDVYYPQLLRARCEE